MKPVETVAKAEKAAELDGCMKRAQNDFSESSFTFGGA